ncbi:MULTISPECIES: hypothetical protein [Paraburkholderia]|uniref:hypothetical protein n=1 Tax=Paraburkholderia TaxID=1822464 RepID=UPI002254DE2A|nr:MULTISPECIES: hypothetical protein [Paraburkholderia]MCX4165871.1 hypothetical protein [Paraburkholderia megapolitana]MDN7161362.1 hypothetical protein [Paraburkholderia sp. CHISQ3]MDQ6498409.1 hypothetical protein [Paraburkholderia megapolitana]
MAKFVSHLVLTLESNDFWENPNDIQIAMPGVVRDSSGSLSADELFKAVCKDGVSIEQHVKCLAFFS